MLRNCDGAVDRIGFEFFSFGYQLDVEVAVCRVTQGVDEGETKDG